MCLSLTCATGWLVACMECLDQMTEVHVAFQHTFKSWVLFMFNHKPEMTPKEKTLKISFFQTASCSSEVLTTILQSFQRTNHYGLQNAVDVPGWHSFAGVWHHNAGHTVCGGKRQLLPRAKWDLWFSWACGVLRWVLAKSPPCIYHCAGRAIRVMKGSMWSSHWAAHCSPACV